MGRAVAAVWIALAASLAAQGPPGGRAGGPPPTAKAAARVDFTGNWVSVVSEDWRWRMITPAKGDYANIPINAAARKIADAWDPAKDQAAGEACKAYAAPAIMREPGRLQISWQDDNTLKIETDAGMQTRVLRFAVPGTPAACSRRADVAGHVSRAMGRAAAGACRQHDSARPRCACRHRQPHARGHDDTHPSRDICERTAFRSAPRPVSRSTSISSKIPMAWTGSSSRPSSAIRSSSMARG